MEKMKEIKMIGVAAKTAVFAVERVPPNGQLSVFARREEAQTWCDWQNHADCSGPKNCRVTEVWAVPCGARPTKEQN